MDPSSSSQFVSSRNIGVYDPIHQFTIWEEHFKSNGDSSVYEPEMKLNNQSEDASFGILGTSIKYDHQEANKVTNKVRFVLLLAWYHGEFVKITVSYRDFAKATLCRFNIIKMQRRLAQNREAARKSRLKKKAHIQQLESCRLKLLQVEQELDHTKQGLYIGGGLDSNNLGFAGSVNSEIATFKMEYEHWVEELNRQMLELKGALSAHSSDIRIGELVNGLMNHYFKLFCMKSDAAKVDVFYVITGMWKTTAEGFFLWIGGFRPSELLKVLVPLIEPLTEEQRFDAYNLEKSCRQAEDALSQGMEKLQGMLVDTVAAGQLVEGTYIPQMDIAIERLEALASFVNQADHLRQETLQQMSRILTVRQTARWLLALGEYFQRLRDLSKLWTNRPREPA
ncbi:transcription factor TGA4 isoform X2 [Medicago truncatula]|uniref:BZIP family transcription factor n=2 Tax=Medicago truncatula TaxID=3880 RepID=G7LB90_MEDTR|nr:transcription factor TGA4 isoform X2 [Medicago truncatula]XP_024629283.1 transcription factor TGA4 isoform X2 [Medicago truncatula]XP_039685585.1 transcription factor TGA4 isoform X2 [Medicago truncatula]XP_039685586.1 transcription factor TGA4 isoform X2 [Medicago truncatula]XP_039685587.1 transcription factor TGA4 isoform X2 [Medicago truncatula]AET04570.2 BZIP family transcription factor [Medicago truncatula]